MCGRGQRAIAALNTYGPNFVPGNEGPPKHIIESVMPLVDVQGLLRWDVIYVGFCVRSLSPEPGKLYAPHRRREILTDAKILSSVLTSLPLEDFSEVLDLTVRVSGLFSLFLIPKRVDFKFQPNVCVATLYSRREGHGHPDDST